MPMTVKQLREALASYPDDAIVHYEAESHDHWQTMLAPAVASLSAGEVAFSDYHSRDKVVEWDKRDDVEGEIRLVVLLSDQN